MNNRELKTIIKMFESSSLSKIRLEREDVTIELEKPTPLTHPVSQTVAPSVVHTVEEKPKTPAKEEPTGTPVKAPLVGTYYEAPAPDQPPFVRVGSRVSKGDTLCIIEAMKVMNEIPAPCDGIVKAIHPSNGEMVMYGQTIVEIE